MQSVAICQLLVILCVVIISDIIIDIFCSISKFFFSYSEQIKNIYNFVPFYNYQIAIDDKSGSRLVALSTVEWYIDSYIV